MTMDQKLLISLSILGLVLCATIMTSGCTDYKTYNNNLYGYSIQYPETWDKDVSVTESICFTNPEDESHVRITCHDSSNDEFRIGSDPSLEDYVDAYNDFAKEYFDRTTIEGDYTTFDDHDAYESEDTYSIEREEYHSKDIIFLDGGYLYEITYTATQDNYDNDLKTADKIIKSFSLDTD